MTYINCWGNRMLRDINTDPMYWLGAAFFSGFLFAAWSWGILYLLSFLIFYEIGYYIYYCHYKKYDDWDPAMRIGLACGALMGFLIGRSITEDDDHEKSIQEFCTSVKKIMNYI